MSTDMLNRRDRIESINEKAFILNFQLPFFFMLRIAVSFFIKYLFLIYSLSIIFTSRKHQLTGLQLVKILHLPLNDSVIVPAITGFFIIKIPPCNLIIHTIVQSTFKNVFFTCLEIAVFINLET